MSSVVPAVPFPSKLNRRRYTRVPTKQMRSCFAGGGVGPADGWVVDISLGGVFLRTSAVLPVGERLAIELPRAGKAPPVCVRGRVVSSGPTRPGMGVRFDAVDPRTATELRELVSGLAPAGLRLELQPADIEVTTIAPIPSAPSAPSGLPKLTAAKPMPIQAVPPPRPSVPQPFDPLENQRLKVHTRGLLMQIGELELQLAKKDRDIETLREAISQLQASNAQLRRWQ